MLAFAPRFLSNFHFHIRNRDSSVGLVTNRPRTTLQRNRGSISNTDNISSLLQSLKTGSAVHPAYFSTGSEDPYQGVKHLGREAHHSPPSNAKIKYECRYTSPSHVSLWRGGVEKDKFIFTFTFTFTPTYRKTETEMVNSISYTYNNTFYLHRSQDTGHTTQAVIVLCLIRLLPSKFKVRLSFTTNEAG